MCSSAEKLSRTQEPEQLGEKSVCHVEEDAWPLASSEAVEPDIEAKHSRQVQYLVEGAARQETCKPQTGSEPDLEYGRFGEYIKQLEDAMGKARGSTHDSCRGRNRVAGCTITGLHG